MPGSQCCLNVRRQFQTKHFWFSDVHPGRFCYSQWRLPLGAMVVYRFVLAAYCVTWLIYTSRNPVIDNGGTYMSIFLFLTTWTYILLTVYLVLHFLCTVVYACGRGQREVVGLWKRLTSENHRRLFDELQVQPSLWANGEYEYVPGDDGDVELNDVTVLSPNNPTLFMKLVWLLYNVASVACIMVTVIFWTMLYPQLPTMSPSDLLLNIQLHAITSVIIFIEHIVSAVPIRLPHCVYSLLYGLLYILFSGILYAVDHKYILYPYVLDWRYPGTTAVVVVVAALVGLPLIQLVLFGWYVLRVHIFNKCNPEEL